MFNYLQVDARNKIVQLKRNNFKDARDQLAQIAKTGDVRDKLNKIRKIEITPGAAADTKVSFSFQWKFMYF